MQVCSRCGGHFQDGSEYGICVSFFKRCVWCYFGPVSGTGTQKERDQVREAYRHRQTHLDWVEVGSK